MEEIVDDQSARNVEVLKGIGKNRNIKRLI